MKRNFYFLFLFFFALACTNNKKQNEKAQDDLDAARTFIDAALKGNFAKAKDYVVKDSTNMQFLDVRERIYDDMDNQEKEQYRNASIHILNVKEVKKDSITIVIYSNSYKNDPDTLKVLKQNGQWLVDVKYLWQHNDDSLFSKPVLTKDSISK